VSQLIDAYAFQYFKKITGHRFLWLRATGSTVISQLIDSFLILWVAFNLLGNWSLSQVFQVGMVQYIYKVSLAILLTPVIYLMHFIIDRYLERVRRFNCFSQIFAYWVSRRLARRSLSEGGFRRLDFTQIFAD